MDITARRVSSQNEELMSNNLMHGVTELAKITYFNTAGGLVKAIEEAVMLTPEMDALIVNVEIAPQTDWQGGTDYEGGQVVLFEETLSDGSKVYNIEVY
jgi:hypothetical protein